MGAISSGVIPSGAPLGSLPGFLSEERQGRVDWGDELLGILIPQFVEGEATAFGDLTGAMYRSTLVRIDIFDLVQASQVSLGIAKTMLSELVDGRSQANGRQNFVQRPLPVATSFVLPPRLRVVHAMCRCQTSRLEFHSLGGFPDRLR